MRYFLAFIAITLAIYHSVTLKQVGYTESQRAAMDELHAEVAGDTITINEIFNITPDNMDTLEFLK